MITQRTKVYTITEQGETEARVEWVVAGVLVFSTYEAALAALEEVTE